MSRSTRYLGVPLMLAVIVPSRPAMAVDEPIEVAAEMSVVQFFGKVPTGARLDDGPVLKAAEASCMVETTGSRSAGIAALGAIVIDWLVGQALRKIREAVVRDIRAHTVSYSNPLRYDDFYAEGKWNKAGRRSCVLVQRFPQCPGNRPEDAPACDVGVPSASILFGLEQSGTALSVEPLAYEFDSFLARHSTARNRAAELAFSVGFTLHAIGAQDAGGFHWDSRRGGAEPVLIEGACPAWSSRKVEGVCQWIAPRMAGARAFLPLPPGGGAASPYSMAAIEVHIVEAGRPRKGSKALASFLEASEGSLSEVAASALKKQWKLGEEG